MVMSAAFLDMRGFSFGTDDFCQNDDMNRATRELSRRVRTAMDQVESIPASTLQKESNRVSIATQFMLQTNALVKSIVPDEFDMLRQMTGCGAKGSDRHVAQMRFGLGQQLVNGCRIMVRPDGALPPSCLASRTTILAHGHEASSHTVLDQSTWARFVMGRVSRLWRSFGTDACRDVHACGCESNAMAAKSINVPRLVTAKCPVQWWAVCDGSRKSAHPHGME